MNELLTTIDAFDKAVVLYVAQQLQTPLVRAFMDFITSSANWKIPLIIFWIWLLWKGGKNGRALAIFILPMFLLSDFGTAKILKPIFGRPRPLNHGGLAMPSAHSANSFAAATLISLLYLKQNWSKFAVYSVAALVAISRVYVGVHYPTDILVGSLLGILDGFIIFVLYKWTQPWLSSKMPRWIPAPDEGKGQQPEEKKDDAPESKTDTAAPEINNKK